MESDGIMSEQDEFWDWKPEAPVKVPCSDHEEINHTYDPHGCIGCSHLECKSIHEDDYGEVPPIAEYWYECGNGHNIVWFRVKRVRPMIKNGRRNFFVMYRTHEPDERPEPIPAEYIAEVLDGIVIEGKAILPFKEGTYKNRFPGGTPEIARRIVEKATRLLDGGADCDTDADTERDLLNYIAIHRALRYREQGKINELMSDGQ